MALYTKYRPRTFDELVGQGVIAEMLSRSLQSKVNHAYLMVGPHGTGKTTVARLIAASVNCEKKLACGKCANCQSIADGDSPDLIEIDAASNRGIENVRGIIDSLQLRPLIGEYKVFIVDEAHMLTDPASNALLKSLEEPPSHVIFILATTELSKVKVTIRSRCQKHSFVRLGKLAIVARLKYIASQEGIELSNEIFDFIASEAQGALRDAISLLELVNQLSDKSIEGVRRAFGKADSQRVYEFVSTLEERSLPKAFYNLQTLIQDQVNLSEFHYEVVDWLRSLLLVSSGAKYEHPLLSKMSSQAKSFTPSDLLMMTRTFFAEKYNPMFPSLHLELASVEVVESLGPVLSDY